MKYMLIDITTAEETRVLLVAGLREVELHGKLYQSQGRKVMAPPVEGRSFAKMEKLPLQYLYWNTTGLVPDDNYPRLIEVCRAAVEAMPVDATPVAHLEREVARLAPVGPAIPSDTGRPPKARGDGVAHPKTGTTTGLVWEIAERLYAENGNQIPDRKLVIAACVAEEINPSTASTQYGKWKGSKLAPGGS